MDELTYNIKKVYPEAVLNAGGMPLVLPYQSFAESFKAFVLSLDGVLLSGGGDIHAEFFGRELDLRAGTVYPERDSFEISLCRFCADKEIPLLCVCRGMQVLNVSLGGDIIQHIDGHSQSAPRSEASHGVNIAPGSLLRKVYGTDRILVNSFHHQAVLNIGCGLRVSAVSDCGITEALEGSGSFCLGVQWHPETLEAGRQLFKYFIDACRRRIV